MKSNFFASASNRAIAVAGAFLGVVAALALMSFLVIRVAPGGHRASKQEGAEIIVASTTRGRTLITRSGRERLHPVSHQLRQSAQRPMPS